MLSLPHRSMVPCYSIYSSEKTLHCLIKDICRQHTTIKELELGQGTMLFAVLSNAFQNIVASVFKYYEFSVLHLSCQSSHFMISLWQYKQYDHPWRYSSVSKAIFTMQIRWLPCSPSLCEWVLSKYYSAVTVSFINQLSMWKRELRIHFWGDITHVQSVLLKKNLSVSNETELE